MTWRRHSLKSAVACASIGWAFSFSATAATEAGRPAGEVFKDSIQPLLEQHCFKCHSHAADKVKGGLMLDSLSGLLSGGDSGPAIVPGKPGESRLLKAVSGDDPDLKMPPKGERLSPGEVTALRDWIEGSVSWPTLTRRDDKDPFTAEDRGWWVIQPVANPAPPSLAGDHWSRNDLDRFVLKRLRDEGLAPAAEADRRTLIRRLSFDLTGLPPSREETEQFVRDTSANAYEALVERLLASPRYGERWAQHWLDLVRYAESDGYRADAYRPNAWRYRDYVVRSFNADKPYDRFLSEQLAGDEIAPNDPDAITATSFLRLWIYEYNNRDVEGQWVTILNDVTDTVSDVFMGVGLQCAKCHDHKFDPLLQKDYFRLQAYFAALLPRDDIPAATAEEFLRHQSQLRAWEKASATVREQIDELREPYLRRADQDALDKFNERLQGLVAKPKTERTPYEHQIAELAYQQLIYEEKANADNKIKGDEKVRLASLREELAKFDHLKPKPLPDVMSASDVGPFASPIFIPKKANLGAIEPGVPSVIDPGPAEIQPLPTAPNSTGRRAELARWLTEPGNPLTSRVIANRVWQYHFGRGLSVNPSDFGRLGEKPTHPDLLDWLATQFVEQGWSMKQLHRLIVTSATYRQAASHPKLADGMLKDPENKLLWHANIRRLDAEQIRDAMLQASGRLDLKAGGPAVNQSLPRRSVYTRMVRNSRDPFLDVFDLPEAINSTARRNVTTTPSQSLTMINGAFTLECAQAMAEQIRASGNVEAVDAARQAYELVLGRAPSAGEMEEALVFIRNQEALTRDMRKEPEPLPFVADKMPFRDGRAAVLKPGSVQERFRVPLDEPLALDAFTVEAFVVVKSVYDDASVRTIAAQWNSDQKVPGWSLGVTGRKSAFKPQVLVLQLAAGSAEAESNYEAVFSDLNIELNKPYFVAAAARLGADGEPEVTFHAKDLSNDNAPMQSMTVKHSIHRLLRCATPVTIGGREGNAGHAFDGLIDDVRFSRGTLPAEQLLLTSETAGPATIGYWQFESAANYQRDASANGHDLELRLKEMKPLVPEVAALEDFCHVLLNANEFLYVD